MKSKRGIYYDLNESDYTFTYKNFIFYFSSILYMNKFSASLGDYLVKETNKLNSFYQCKVKFDNMLLLSLYKKIEKRGFKVKYRNYEIDEKYHISSIIGD